MNDTRNTLRSLRDSALSDYAINLDSSEGQSGTDVLNGVRKSLPLDRAYDFVLRDSRRTDENNLRRKRSSFIRNISHDALNAGINLIILSKGAPLIGDNDEYHKLLIRDLSERSASDEEGERHFDSGPDAVVAYLEVSDFDETLIENWQVGPNDSHSVQYDALPFRFKLLPKHIHGYIISRTNIKSYLPDSIPGINFEDIDNLEATIEGVNSDIPRPVVHVHKHIPSFTKRFAIGKQNLYRILRALEVFFGIAGIIGLIVSLFAGFTSTDEYIEYTFNLIASFIKDPVGFIKGSMWQIIFIIIVAIFGFARKVDEIENRGMSFAREQVSNRSTILIENGLDDWDEEQVLDRLGFSSGSTIDKFDVINDLQRHTEHGHILYVIRTPIERRRASNGLQLISFGLRDGFRDRHGNTTWFSPCLSEIAGEDDTAPYRHGTRTNIPQFEIKYGSMSAFDDYVVYYVLDDLWDLCDVDYSNASVELHQIIPLRDSVYVVFGAEQNSYKELQALFEQVVQLVETNLDTPPCIRVFVVTGETRRRGEGSKPVGRFSTEVDGRHLKKGVLTDYLCITLALVAIELALEPPELIKTQANPIIVDAMNEQLLTANRSTREQGENER